MILILSFTLSPGPGQRFVKISATIITYNEERNLPRAIESLRCADEIVVIDSGSTDRTVEIAEKLGARVVERAWPGYAKQKNFAAEQAAHDWILSLDADESLSEALEAEICGSEEAHAAMRRLHHAAPGAISGPLDSALGLVSGSQGAALRSPQSQMGGRLRARVGEGGGHRRASRIEPAALHLRFVVGAFEDHGSLHDARRRADDGSRQERSRGGA